MGRTRLGGGQFNAVHGIDVDRNRRIYVVDRLNKRVQVFDASGKHLAKWPNIRFPNHVQVTDPRRANEHRRRQIVWVADNMTTEVMKYDTQGQRLFSWNASGARAGRLRRTAPVLGRLEGQRLHRGQRPWPAAEAGAQRRRRPGASHRPSVRSCRRRNSRTLLR